MESPNKKRKIVSQESKATSTPQRQSDLNYHEESPAFSRIDFQASSSNSSSTSRVSFTNRRLRFPVDKGDDKKFTASDRSSLLDVIEKSYSIADTTEESDVDILDYDEFFRKLKRFKPKGQIWNLYKPIGEEDGSLYHQILLDPRKAVDTAEWFASYCTNKPQRVVIFVIYKFCLDCAGYQKFNIKMYFPDPLPPIPKLVSDIMDKAENELCDAEVFTTGKFLFADKTKLAKILQMGVYNFIQKFVIEANNQKVLYKEMFIYLLSLLEAMCKASHRQLMYTGVIFVIKVLTAICMVKAEIPDSSLGEKQQVMLDHYINTLYFLFVKACQCPDHECVSLKLACINELKIWIQYSAKVFLDHFNCVSIVGKLLLDENKSVRLSALEMFQKIVLNSHLVEHLQKGPIENIVEHVSGRFYDVDINVALKAIEVYLSMIPHYTNTLDKKKKIFENLIEIIYHKDYKMGSISAKCIINFLNRGNHDEKIVLVDLCKIATKFYPNLKPLLVESFIIHTTVLQNWSLITGLLANPHFDDLELKTTLSDLFLESVHQSITGTSSTVRKNSRIVKDVDLTYHKQIADEIYPHLEALLVLNSKHPIVAGNILKILVKIKPEYLSKNHIEISEKILNYFGKFFILWNDEDQLLALLDYLVYINENIPLISSSARDTIEDLKKYVSQELYKSFKSRDSQTIRIAKKTSLVFSKFDLNDHIECSKLLVSWDIIESNVKYLEDMMQCCHWSLIWKIKKLSFVQYSKPDQNKEVLSLKNMSRSFFNNCIELLTHQDQNKKFKAFERLCQTYMSFSLELENISKQIHSLEELKPFLDEPLEKQIKNVFELVIENCEDSVVQKYAMYIVNMSILKILPMDSISTIIKYYDNHYQKLGNLVESVCWTIHEKEENWTPLLLVNTICECLETINTKHGIIDIRSQEIKYILNLSRRLSEFKKINTPKTASKVLFYAINYAVEKRQYEILIFARFFINEIQNNPENLKEILEYLKKKVPKEDYKEDAIFYFAEHLTRFKPDTKVSKVLAKKGKRQVLRAPKLNIQTSKIVEPNKFKRNVPTQKPSQTTDTDVSDDMTIHDTSSDDSDIVSNLNISKD